MKTILIIILVLSVGCHTTPKQSAPADIKQPIQAVPEPEPVYKGLRNLFFTSKPEKLGFTQQGSHPTAWGILMEIGFPETVATLVSLRDGNASLYLGTGGGIIGGVGHEKVKNAAISFVEDSEKYLDVMDKTESYPYPAVGRVRFYVLTFNGVMTAEADVNELGEGKHKLSPLYYSGQEVLTQLRLVSDSQKEGEPNKSLNRMRH